MRGSLLVLALWVLALLSTFAITAGYQMRQKMTLADRIDLRNWLHGIAEAGIDQTISELKKTDPTSGFDPFTDWASSPVLYRHVAVGGGSFTVSYRMFNSVGEPEVRYGPQDEESKINLNLADPQVMSRLFQAAGLDSDQADEIAYSIVDWRDSDSFLSNPNYDAEDDYYEGLDTPYGAKDKPFEVLDELLLVRGVTPEIFEQVKGKATVYGAGAVNINTAPKEVLMTVGMDAALADKIISYRKGTDGKEPSADDQAFTDTASLVLVLANQQLSGAEQAVLNDLAARNWISVISSAFHVRSTGELPGKRRALEIEAVVERTGKIRFWSAGVPRRMSDEEITGASVSDAASEESAP